MSARWISCCWAKETPQGTNKASNSKSLIPLRPDLDRFCFPDVTGKVEHRTRQRQPVLVGAHDSLAHEHLEAERAHALREAGVLAIDHETVDDAKIFARGGEGRRFAAQLAHHPAGRALHG